MGYEAITISFEVTEITASATDQLQAEEDNLAGNGSLSMNQLPNRIPSQICVSTRAASLSATLHCCSPRSYTALLLSECYTALLLSESYTALLLSESYIAAL